MSKLSVLSKLCAAFLISSPLSAQTVVVDTTPVSRIITTVNGKSDTAVLYSRPWKPNQRILLIMEDTVIRLASDSVKGRVYVRDENNVPISRPQFFWSLTNVAIFDGRTTVDNQITLIGRPFLYYNRNVLAVELGTFRDSSIVVTGRPP